MPSLKPGLLPKLAIHRLLGGLVRANTALRKLPGTLTDTFTPEDAPLGVAQDDPNVMPKSVRINHLQTPVAT